MQTKVILIPGRRRRPMAVVLLIEGYLGAIGLLARDDRVHTRSAPAAREAGRSAPASVEVATHPRALSRSLPRPPGLE